MRRSPPRRLTLIAIWKVACRWTWAPRKRNQRDQGSARAIRSGNARLGRCAQGAAGRTQSSARRGGLVAHDAARKAGRETAELSQTLAPRTTASARIAPCAQGRSPRFRRAAENIDPQARHADAGRRCTGAYGLHRPAEDAQGLRRTHRRRAGRRICRRRTPTGPTALCQRHIQTGADRGRRRALYRLPGCRGLSDRGCRSSGRTRRPPAGGR